MGFSQFITPDEFKRYGIKFGVPNELSYLQVELTDKCNLACPSCPRATVESSNGLLEPFQFEEILIQNTSIKQVSFVGAGEALMLKNFSDYVKVCARHNVFSSVNTNGVLIKHRLPEAVNAGLGKVAISVDAAEEDLLGYIRSGLRKDTLREAMVLGVEITANSDTRISAAVTLGQENLHQFADTLRFIDECGIRKVTVESIHHWGNDKSLNKHSLFHGNASQIVEKIEAGLHVAEDLDLSLEIFDYRRILAKDSLASMNCAWPWDATYLTCNGDVTPCCINLEAKDFNRMGNIKDESLSQIWRGERYAEFRSGFTTGQEWEFCKECVYRMEFGEISK